MPTYVATDVFHHPDGVVLAGETVELSEEDAKRGLDHGRLFEAQPSVMAKLAAKAEPTE